MEQFCFLHVPGSSPKSSTRSFWQVVSREAVFYGLIEGEGKFPLISWLLPYVQRYLYRFHREAYSSLKRSEFRGPSQLKVITVETLFYRRVLKGCGNANISKKRFECSCLLQVSDSLYRCC